MSDETKRVELKLHPLIERLVEDPASPPEVTELVGYLGKSTRAGHVRVYASLDLNEYTDVPEAAVRHAEEVPDTELEHGGTRLWLDAKAEVVHEVRTTVRVEARFLEGAIAQAHLRKEPAPPVAVAPEGAVEEEGWEDTFGAPETALQPLCTPRCIMTAQTCAPLGDCRTAEPTCIRTRCGATCDATCPQTLCGATCPRTRCAVTCRTCPRTCMVSACMVSCPRTLCAPTCIGRTCPRMECPLRTPLCARREPFGTPVTQATACRTICGATCLPTRCLQTCGATCPPTRCLQTCMVSCRPTCGATCLATRCGATCQATCLATCLISRCRPTCLATCLISRCQPTCLATCARTCFRTCLCPERTPACPIERTPACPIERTIACGGPEAPEVPEVEPFGGGYGGWGGGYGGWGGGYGGEGYGYGYDPGDYDPYGGPWYGDDEPWEL